MKNMKNILIRSKIYIPKERASIIQNRMVATPTPGKEVDQTTLLNDQKIYKKQMIGNNANKIICRVVLGLIFLGFTGAVSSTTLLDRKSGESPVHNPSKQRSNHAKKIYFCGDQVYREAVDLWKDFTRIYVSQEKLKKQLVGRGDIYALYDIEQHVFSFNEMARRCKDEKLLKDVVRLLLPVFDYLSEFEYPKGVRAVGWVCSGARKHCGNKVGRDSRLINGQFLGLLGAVSTNVLETIPEARRESQEIQFVQKTAGAMAHQINRWLTESDNWWLDTYTSRLSVKPEDQKPGKTEKEVYTRQARLFSDRDLWALIILSDLSGLVEAGVSMDVLGREGLDSLKAKSELIGNMFDLFVQRLSYFDTPDGKRADIDVGFQRYDAEPYALYTDEKNPPARCTDGRIEILIPPSPEYYDPYLTWDFSHARRFPVALESFARNKSNLKKVFNYNNLKFDPEKIRKALANQVVKKIWNGDSELPLFGNYWNGDNGYQSVAEEGLPGTCYPGYPPYTLGQSFANGNFILWGEFNQTIRRLGERLYELMSEDNERAEGFMNRYYETIGSYDEPSATAKIWRINFLADLVIPAP